MRSVRISRIAWVTIPLRFPHTQALISALADEYAATTANRMLSARRGVFKATWKLGLLSGEDYQKAASVASVRGETVPAGHALAGGELVVRGKGNKQRAVPVGNAAPALADWLAVRDDAAGSLI